MLNTYLNTCLVTEHVWVEHLLKRGAKMVFKFMFKSEALVLECSIYLLGFHKYAI